MSEGVDETRVGVEAVNALGPVLPPPAPPLTTRPPPPPPSSFPPPPPPTTPFVTAVFRRPGRLAGLTQISLILVVVASTVAAGVSAAAHRMVGQVIEAPTSVAVDDVQAAQDRRLVALVIAAVVLLASAGLVIGWTRRLYGNLRALGVTDLRFGVGWAVGAWFVPFLNLVRPKQIVDDIWRGSDPSPLQLGGRWHDGSVPTLINAWWGVGIAGFVIQRFASGAAGSDGVSDLDSLHRALIWEAIGYVTIAVGAILTLAVVRQCSERQETCATARLGQPTVERRIPDAVTVFGPAVLGLVAFGSAFFLADVDVDESASAGSSKHVTELQVGDCFDLPDGGPDDGETVGVLGVDIIPCDEPHQAEIFALVTHPADRGASYPGEEALFDFAGDACVDAFESAVGVPGELSSLELSLTIPTATMWSGGARVSRCATHDYMDRRLLASVLDSGGHPPVEE